MTTLRRVTSALALCGLCSMAAAGDDLDSLFDLDKPLDSGESVGTGLRWSGYGEFAAAYTYPDPGHWSKLRARFELAAAGRLGGGAKFKIAGRADADGAFDLENDFYPAAVRRDQRSDFTLREAYVDTSAGSWEFRFGHQHVVWGEMVGLFVADVVSPRDLREFILPEFEAMRIPQWAARAEYYGGDVYAELLWIPFPSYDDIGRPGSDFYPYPLPAGTGVHERKPSHGLGRGNWGARVTKLIDGWDLSAFYYRSLDASPTLYSATPTSGFELRHGRIRQVGGTVSKDLGSFVLKGEAVHTHGRDFATFDPDTGFDVAQSDTLDYVVGIDIPVRDVWRFNIQHFARVTYSHTSAIGTARNETGFTLLVNRKLGDDFEAEVLLVSSLEREDYMLRPKLSWSFSRDWRAQLGADIFKGAKRGLFGRFDDSDRVYMEVRRWF